MFDDLLSKNSKNSEVEEDIEKVYENFWKDILEKDGILDMQQLKKELYDFWNVIKNVPKVYNHITGGKVSKVLTDPQIVCDLADEFYKESYEDTPSF